jgi:hypothetical protein
MVQSSQLKVSWTRCGDDGHWCDLLLVNLDGDSAGTAPITDDLRKYVRPEPGSVAWPGAPVRERAPASAPRSSAWSVKFGLEQRVLEGRAARGSRRGP